jgi:5,10-methylene-tetrahydrofolate dehydrogenase/methenyl tetrahydrofolate cyclohydrolase
VVTLRRGLAVVLVGSRKDSETYVRSKKKAEPGHQHLQLAR